MASELLEREIYANKYLVTHNPLAKGRAPRYKVLNREDGEETRPAGVTTILSKTLAKDLMGWAVDMALELLRQRLPVITEKDLQEAKMAHLVKRDAGASTGTEAHAMAEHYLKGIVQEGKPSVEAANAYKAFVDWFETMQPTILNVEEVVYSELGYAGTYDCMLEIDGKVYLCDLKTTNASKTAPQGVYAENFLQLGAYAAAHNEQADLDELVKIDDLMVISCKKDGKLDVVTASGLGLSVEDCTSMFYKVFHVYEFLAKANKTLKGGIK